MPDEHEVPGIADTTEPPPADPRRPGPAACVSPLPVPQRGEVQPWRDSKQRVDDALAPAIGIAVAVLIATLWALIAGIVQ